MFKLSIEKLRPNMRVGQNIYNAKGHLLLGKDIILNNSLILQLKQLNLPSIYISSEFPNIEIAAPPLLLQEQTRVKAIYTLRNAFHKCRLSKSSSVNIDVLTDSVKSIIENILTNKNTIIQATDIRKHDDYTFAHSINVCALSTLIGSLCGYSSKMLYELSLGALLHDVGKTQIPLKILNKPASLTNDEFELVKAHSEIGFELLRHTKSFSVVPMHAAFQHHEKYDGSGYPRRLAGKDIHEYARIVAIADVYDALTSDRAYKKACTPDVARRIMLKESVGHFDPTLINLFFSHVAVYPIGTIVKLNTDFYAVVVDVHEGKVMYPTIRLLADPNKNLIVNSQIIDLSENKISYSIKTIVKDDELVDLMMTPKNRQNLL